MMNVRQRSVNVSRVELIVKLKENLNIHAAEYKQALLDFHERLVADLEVAALKVKSSDPASLEDFRINFTFPQNHEEDYRDVIEMLQMSVDDTINLDSEAFKAYIKNEWSWQRNFKATTEMYKIAGSMLS